MWMIFKTLALEFMPQTGKASSSVASLRATHTFVLRKTMLKMCKIFFFPSLTNKIQPFFTTAICECAALKAAFLRTGLHYI